MSMGFIRGRWVRKCSSLNRQIIKMGPATRRKELESQSEWSHQTSNDCLVSCLKLIKTLAKLQQLKSHPSPLRPQAILSNSTNLYETTHDMRHSTRFKQMRKRLTNAPSPQPSYRNLPDQVQPWCLENLLKQCLSLCMKRGNRGLRALKELRGSNNDEPWLNAPLLHKPITKDHLPSKRRI